jgi:hypothetical protein
MDIFTLSKAPTEVYCTDKATNWGPEREQTSTPLATTLLDDNGRGKIARLGVLMYDPETHRQERERLRAEIEANRTAEQRAEADQIRVQRAAYESLPNNKKTELEELEVFDAFVAAAGIDVDPNSRANAPTPEPDIRCTINGQLRYFELGEITDPSVARTTADALKYDEPRGTSFSQTEPFAYIVGKKRTRTYATNGSPIELVLYYRNQYAPWPTYFADLLANNMEGLAALVTGGTFQRVWIFDFAKGTVLWHS